MPTSFTLPVSLLQELFRVINNLTNSGILSDVRKLIYAGLAKLQNTGMYRVIEYRSSLELMDTKGHRSRFHKQEKVQYLQDNIIAFQDQAWGDGKILIDYQCKPGLPVDRYRSGFKTHILISLREVKSKNDVDTFTMDWRLQKAFLKPTGFWTTAIDHRTDFVRAEVMFPKTRPPQRVTLVEKNRQKTYSLGNDNVKQLPNGKWLVTWEKSKPELHEQYILNWIW